MSYMCTVTHMTYEGRYVLPWSILTLTSLIELALPGVSASAASSVLGYNFETNLIVCESAPTLNRPPRGGVGGLQSGVSRSELNRQQPAAAICSSTSASAEKAAQPRGEVCRSRAVCGCSFYGCGALCRTSGQGQRSSLQQAA
jgi:hypothetical protein